MSQFMRQRAIVYEIKVGSTNALQFNVYDDTGTTLQNLNNTSTYATGKLKVWKPDGTLVIDGALTFTDRANGLVTYAVTTSDSVATNAGKWEGEIELISSDTTTITLQSETFTFIIRNSY